MPHLAVAAGFRCRDFVGYKKEHDRRLHRDPSIISRLDSVYAVDRDRNNESRLVKELQKNKQYESLTLRVPLRGSGVEGRVAKTQ